MIMDADFSLKLCKTSGSPTGICSVPPWGVGGQSWHKRTAGMKRINALKEELQWKAPKSVCKLSSHL